ncbi:MAG: rhodanese-like domain-containing protein [Verrucomicrobiales bacterium]|nr:rhodanese-like domain-containing protein [Verrucomicrobiales bacterium]
MEWSLWFLGALVILAWIALKRSLSVPESVAHRLLAEGAVVVDVRSPAEFAQDHVEGAVNVPLGEIAQHIAQAVPDRRTPVLAYCQGGGRSAIASHRMRALGYERVYNLGSLGRAKSLVRQ